MAFVSVLPPSASDSSDDLSTRIVFGEVLFSLNSDLVDLPDRRHGRTEVASLPLRLKKSNEIVIKVI